jgi:hypothetical protein
MAERKPDEPGGPTFLRRWSQRKLAAAREAVPPAPVPGAASAPAVASEPHARAAAPEATAPATPQAPPAELPSLDSLTFDSDFRAFLGPKVEEGTRRAALRKLFSDPRFNVMDGLDVYIDDYTKFEPVTPELLKQMAHARYIFDPPRTRVNEQGYVEDVVDEPAAAEGAQEAQAQPEGSGEAATAEGAPAPATDAPAPDAPAPGGEPEAMAPPSPPEGDDVEPSPLLRPPHVHATTPAR